MAGMLISQRESLYKSFKTKRLGRAKDFDGNSGIQCVDLAKLFAFEVFGVKIGTFPTGAFSGYTNKYGTFDLKKWKQVPYTNGMIPVAGDIIFWNKTPGNGNYGHVAIAGPGSTAQKLVLLEQNYVAVNSKDFGKGTGGAAITERVRGYKDFAGCWRFMG